MENLPAYVAIVFILTTLLCVYFFYKAAGHSKFILILLLVWLLIQAVVASTGFFTITTTIPPRFILLVGPPVIAIIFLFLLKRGRNFIDGLDLKTLTLLHTVRVPVELVLYWLFVYKKVPQIMTFEGNNLDILSGISAPIIYYIVFVKKWGGKKMLITWNVICLALLFNIVITAVLSVPTPFQKLAFDQPNVAILYFPFVWLPCCVVPLVLLAHLTSLRQLI